MQNNKNILKKKAMSFAQRSAWYDKRALQMRNQLKYNPQLKYNDNFTKKCDELEQEGLLLVEEHEYRYKKPPVNEDRRKLPTKEQLARLSAMLKK